MILEKFTLDDTTHAKEVPGRSTTLESMNDHLVFNTVSRDILEEVREKSLIGKAAYLYIKDQYGVLQLHEQIQYITDLYDKILSNSVKFEKKMLYFNNIWKFLTKTNESERECLKHFIWIHQTLPKFEQHFKAQNLVISEKELTKTIRIFQILMRRRLLLPHTDLKVDLSQKINLVYCTSGDGNAFIVLVLVITISSFHHPGGLVPYLILKNI